MKQKGNLQVNREAQEKYQPMITYGLYLDPDSHQQTKKQ